ncbi:hypothetical protein NIES37_66880 [Tolypothrix tenuis PCC 7101]|uniref:Uncharacterized protein n=1 Tax=Tolypothrix tenuis PCC 7101 TaxID=231146 RepID=A0A1Z4NAI0_9CYAN|nr:hypothetical protein NIES37_66880 [Tolypothrix tenuis PCC 7101]BAZ78432.1 hypothetical protein NIES50_70650 [Aulosira laxa NIES-50]
MPAVGCAGSSDAQHDHENRDRACPCKNDNLFIGFRFGGSERSRGATNLYRLLC